MVSFVRTLKRKCIKALSIIKYLLSQYRRDRIKLSSYGISRVVFFKVRQWKFNKEKMRTRVYYKAIRNGEKCFVKIGKSDGALKNEINIYKYLKQCNIKFVPQYLISEESYDNDRILLVLQYLEGVNKFKTPKTEDEFNHICNEFEAIHACFCKFGILQRDISITNIYMNNENKMVVTDFGMGVSPGSDVSLIDPESNVGTYFIFTEKTRIYDDAYSFVRMLDECGIPSEYKEMECYRRIEKLVGIHTHSLVIKADSD